MQLCGSWAIHSVASAPSCQDGQVLKGSLFLPRLAFRRFPSPSPPPPRDPQQRPPYFTTVLLYGYCRESSAVPEQHLIIQYSPTTTLAIFKAPDFPSSSKSPPKTILILPSHHIPRPRLLTGFRLHPHGIFTVSREICDPFTPHLAQNSPRSYTPLIFNHGNQHVTIAQDLEPPVIH